MIPLDLFLFKLINGLARQNKFLDGLVVFLAEYLPYCLIVLAVFLLFRKEKDWRRRIFIFSVFAISAILARGIITETVRFIFSRQRPFAAFNLVPLVNHDMAGAFPSGHMTFYFVLALTIFLLNRKWGWFFVGSAALMGLARVMAGVHWPSDILGGILIAFLSYFLIKKILPDKTKTA